MITSFDNLLQFAVRRNVDKKRNLCEDDVVTPTQGGEEITIAPSTWSHESLELIYPEEGEDAVTITTEQIRRLDSTTGTEAYLDDVIIDFYMRSVQSLL